MNTLYEKDFCQWSLIQSSHLRNNEIDELDIENLIEEIESLGKNNKSALRSYLIRLMIHLLKIKYANHQKGNSKSWGASVLSSIDEIEFLLKDSPSLKNFMKEVFPECYEKSVRRAALETSINIEQFPKDCPWTIQGILEEMK